jgi:thymidylate synthase
MKQYLDDLRFILGHGGKREDRTGTGTISTFGLQTRYNLQDGFPAVTTKKLWFKGVVHELLWFLQGDTNIKYLVDNGVHIWDEWADTEGNLGPVYGWQWRGWGSEITRNGPYTDIKQGKDQIVGVIESLKTNPNSRRHLVSAWNVGELDKMALPPCHYAFQFYVSGGKLSCMFNMRSCDWFMGAPFNIASYSLLTHMIAQVVGLEVGEVIMTVGDAHIYLNHLDQVQEQLSRTILPLSKLWLNPAIENIYDFKFEDVKLVDYQSHPTIKGEIAV